MVAYTEFGMCKIFTSDIITLLTLSSMSVIILALIVTMLGKLMSNRKMEMWSSNMIYDVITTLIISGIFVTLFSAFSSDIVGSPWIQGLTIGTGTPQYFDSSKCVFGNAMSYLGTATTYTLNVARLAIWANANMEVLISTTRTQPTIGMGFGSYTSNLGGQPLYPSLVKVRDMISGVLNLAIMTAITANTAQLFLLKMVLSPILLSLLAFAIVLRPIPMFKYFSNSIISLMISFMLIFPLVVALEGMIFGITQDDIDDIYDATTYQDEAKDYNVKMVGDDWGNLLLEALMSGVFSKKWEVKSESDVGLVVKEGSNYLIKTGPLMQSAYHAFFYSSFILAINVISIVAGTKAIATLMDEEESLMEMFIKVV